MAFDRPGRPRKMTPRMQKLIIEMLTNGHTITFACETLNVSRKTEWTFRQGHPEYAKLVEDAMDARVELVEESLYAKALSGDVNAIRFWLLNRAARRWHPEMYDRTLLFSSEGNPRIVQVREVIVELPPPEDDTNVIDAEVKSDPGSNGTEPES